VVYPLTTSPYGFDIYGIDENGKVIGEKTNTSFLSKCYSGYRFIR